MSRRPSCTSLYTGSSFPSRGLQRSPSASGYASLASTATPSGDRGGRESTRLNAGRRRRATSRRRPRRSSLGRDDVALRRRQKRAAAAIANRNDRNKTSLYSDEQRERGRVYVAARTREKRNAGRHPTRRSAVSGNPQEPWRNIQQRQTAARRTTS